MRPIALLLLVSVAVISQAKAQDGPHELPGIIIGNDKNKGGDNSVAPEPLAPKPVPKPSGNGSGAPVAGGAANGAGAPSGKCTGKESEPAEAMRCLNQELKGQVDKVNPVPNAPPIDAKSGDTKTGVVNIPGVAQQYGKNFGISAFPQRPPPPTFTPPKVPPPNFGTAPIRAPPTTIFHR